MQIPLIIISYGENCPRGVAGEQTNRGKLAGEQGREELLQSYIYGRYPLKEDFPLELQFNCIFFSIVRKRN